MQFSTVYGAVVLASLAAAAPTLEERAGALSLSVYSDANCGTLIRTVTPANNTCIAVSQGFNSVKVAANPTTQAFAHAWTSTDCSKGLTSSFFVNNASCHNGFQFGTAVGLNVIFAS